RPDPFVEGGRPRSGDGTLLCPAQLPGALASVAANGLIGINSIVLLFFSKPHLHHEDLETLEFMDALGHQLGGWYALARDAGQVEGRWGAPPARSVGRAL